METHESVSVLEVIRQGKVGGGESHLLSLVKNLDQAQFNPVVLSFTTGPMVDELRRLGFKTYVVETERAFDLRILRKVLRILQQESIKLIHAHGSRAYTNVLWLAQALRIPIVYTVHGWSFHDDQKILVRQARLLSEEMLVRRAHRTISVSQSDQATGQECFGTFESTVINNGIDLHRFRPDRSLRDIRAEYEIPPSAFVIGFVSRVTHQKNPLGMIEAFGQVVRQVPNVRLLMIGEGELREQAEVAVEKLGIDEYVYFDNFRQDIPSVLQAIDLYCLPSLWEGLPIGLLEAMAMKKVVIATDVNGSREVIEHRVNGLLIPPGNVGRLTEAILTLYHQPELREEMQSKAQATVNERYSAAYMTWQVEEIYRQIVSRTVCFLLLLVSCTISLAQDIDYNKVILPADATDIDFGEKLVQLAWRNNPANDQLIEQANAAHEEVALARWSWLRSINASGNLNEYTINPPEQPNGFQPFFPRYNFGVTLSLGTIFLTPIETRIAQSKHRVAEGVVDERKLTLRAEVLTRYQTYLMNQKLFAIQNEVTEDEYSEFLLTEREFKDGQVSLEDYKQSLKGYNTELTERITLERDLKIAQLALEEIIGVKLEDVSPEP